MDSRTIIERLLREHYRRRSPRTEDIEIARGSLAPVVAGGCLRIILLAFLIMMVAMYVLSSLGGMFLVYWVSAVGLISRFWTLAIGLAQDAHWSSETPTRRPREAANRLTRL
jgi:hypothetical protein